MQGAGSERARVQSSIAVDDWGAVAVILACLGLIAIGKETATVQSVLLMVVGFQFGKHTRKGK